MPLLVLIAFFVVLLVVLPLIGLALWTFLSIAVVGIVIGGLARLILPGRQRISLLATILLGWIGSLLGGFLGYHVLHTGRLLTVLLEIAISALLIAIVGQSNAYQGNRGQRL